jgi:hypothetical protein
MDEEAKRVNVDSAKKRAVVQRMLIYNFRHGLRRVQADGPGSQHIPNQI